MKSTQTFSKKPREIAKLESFVSACEFLEPQERNRLLIITGEMFDNLADHSRKLVRNRIRIRIRKTRGGVDCLFFFKSRNFADFAEAAGPDSLVPAGQDRSRYFDRSENRYRGMGLAMCRNLSRSLRFRSGSGSSGTDAIIVRLSPDSR